jgi:hypothetical protein
MVWLLRTVVVVDDLVDLMIVDSKVLHYRKIYSCRRPEFLSSAYERTHRR